MAARLLPLVVSAILAASAVVPAFGLTDPPGGTGGGPVQGSLHVQVVADGSGTPIPGAFVMVGPRPGDPIADNWGLTGSSGEIAFSEPTLVGPVTVTAGAAGYTWFTICSVDAADLVLPLRPVTMSSPGYRVGDFVSGIDVNNGSFHYGDGQVDLALVIPAMQVSSLLSFDMAGLMGPPEIIEILGQQFEVPSNLFLPQQWELFIEIIKDHYALYLPAGTHTLTAISARVPLEALLNSSDVMDLLPLMQWREIDIREVNITGDTNDADLTVDPDLQQTVTLNLANLPENSTAWCFSVGDLENLSGLGRLVPLGVSSFACPAGGGPCAGDVRLTTTPATGEFAGMAYFPAVAINTPDTADGLVLLQRAAHPQNYSEDMTTWFRFLDLSHDGGAFAWTDAENPASGSPPVHVQLARIADAGTGEVHWEFMVPGGQFQFEAPSLPPEAPPSPAPGSTCTWDQVAIGLGYDLPAFDFNSFAFSDIYAHASHLASDAIPVEWTADPTAVPGTPVPPAGSLVAVPNPFRHEVSLRFRIDQAGPVSLRVYDSAGRQVSQLGTASYGPGAHALTWTGLDASGRALPYGVYLAKLSAPGVERTARLVLRR